MPAEIFLLVTGGGWNVYSCNHWQNAATLTESQVEKLDFVGEALGLNPGERLLDLGCGWGGALVYLCKRSGVTACGIMFSPTQRAVATQRISDHAVDARIVECHWRDFEDRDGFDAIYSDEVLVHINDLGGLFHRCMGPLRTGDRMLNKELHLTHAKYAERMTCGSALINEIFGFAGNYRTLRSELELMEGVGFETVAIHTMPGFFYQRTINEWIAKMQRPRNRLVQLVGQDYFRRFYAYLRITRTFVTSRAISVDAVVARR